MAAVPASVAALIGKIGDVILTPLIFLMFALAVLAFLWGVYKYLVFIGSEEARRTGGRAMLYGIIGMLIMVAVIGIITIICNTLGIPDCPI